MAGLRASFTNVLVALPLVGCAAPGGADYDAAASVGPPASESCEGVWRDAEAMVDPSKPGQPDRAAAWASFVDDQATTLAGSSVSSGTIQLDGSAVGEARIVEVASATWTVEYAGWCLPE